MILSLLLAATLAAPPVERARATALAKAFASEALPRLGASAIQVFGGIGFTAELDIHRYYRRLLSLSLLGGDASHQLERIAEWVCEEAERG